MVRRTLRMGLLSAALLASAASGAATPTQVSALGLATTIAAPAATVPDPGQQVAEMARLFRANDLVGLVRAALPEARYAQIRAEYESHRNDPADADDRQRFAEKWGEFIAPGAVDALMVELEPKLAEVRPKIAGAKLMAAGALQMAASGGIDNELTPSQRESLNAVLPGLTAWMSNTDFLSEQTLREALGYLTDAARGTGIRTLDDVKALNFEQMLTRAGSMLAAGKRALRLYGLDADAIVSSLRVEVLEIAGDRAKVRTTVTVFDAPVSSEHELYLVEGRWGSKHGFQHIRFDHDEDKHDGDINVEIDAEVKAEADA